MKIETAILNSLAFAAGYLFEDSVVVTARTGADGGVQVALGHLTPDAVTDETGRMPTVTLQEFRFSEDGQCTSMVVEPSAGLAEPDDRTRACLAACRRWFASGYGENEFEIVMESVPGR
jgi:hypothetical protein